MLLGQIIPERFTPQPCQMDGLNSRQDILPCGFIPDSSLLYRAQKPDFHGCGL
jgi:hypothetical protein